MEVELSQRCEDGDPPSSKSTAHGGPPTAYRPLRTARVLEASEAEAVTRASVEGTQGAQGRL